MSTKATQKTTSAKKEAAKESAKKNSKAAPKTEKKLSKPEVEEIIEEAPPAVHADAEDTEELEEEADASSSSGGGNAAALAAAGGNEMSASFKNFRHHPDMENFYRFIFENDLRHEALAIIDEMIADKVNKKQHKTVK